MVVRPLQQRHLQPVAAAIFAHLPRRAEEAAGAVQCRTGQKWLFDSARLVAAAEARLLFMVHERTAHGGLLFMEQEGYSTPNIYITTRKKKQVTTGSSSSTVLN